MTTKENTPISPEVALLNDRLKKLEDKNLDWAAWKKGTLLVLEKIFGKTSLYVAELVRTDYEFSSWSLRDTSGGGDPVKASCKELLQICVTDVSSRLPNETGTPAQLKEKVAETLGQFLDPKSMEELVAIINAQSPPMEKEERLLAFLKKKLPKHQGAMLGRLLLLLLRTE